MRRAAMLHAPHLVFILLIPHPVISTSHSERQRFILAEIVVKRPFGWCVQTARISRAGRWVLNPNSSALLPYACGRKGRPGPIRKAVQNDTPWACCHSAANYCQQNTHFGAFPCIFLQPDRKERNARRACIYALNRVLGRSGFEPLKA
jgi:hypothetical protein